MRPDLVAAPGARRLPKHQSARSTGWIALPIGLVAGWWAWRLWGAGWVGGSLAPQGTLGVDHAVALGHEGMSEVIAMIRENTGRDFASVPAVFVIPGE
jgi:hypothetical protein